MKAIVCDRCGAVKQEAVCSTINFPYGTLDEPSEIHLCLDCSYKLRRWVNKEVSPDER